jgi:hypothetical protein
MEMKGLEHWRMKRKERDCWLLKASASDRVRGSGLRF